MLLWYFDFRPGTKLPFRVMHRKEVTHSNGSYERKSLVGGNWLTKWDEVKNSHGTLID